MRENILNPEQKSNLELLGKIPEIEQFYLAGGTALALQIGHRYSVDLDFFTARKFSTSKLLKKLLAHSNCVKQSISKGTLYVALNNVSCSFIVYLYPLIDQTVSSPWGVQLASIVDIGAMKINAIGGRGYRRDFVDLYFLAQIRSLPVIWEDFKKRYADTGLSTFHVKKSLTYFMDAEKDPLPKMIKPVNWKKVREFFEKETKNLEL
ncbi:nucleotidyl transferase AbiEii/AbiGii toxin family protein [candidate division KSB1 bacterium]|nr:nucleotidyl transferase AbiEii/AbiGii toxin family protein [candidate division KSB1 bacterium]